MEEWKYRTKKKRRKKRTFSWQALLYILLGVLLFFGVVYGSEVLLRLFRQPPSETPRPTGILLPRVEEMEVVVYFANADFTALVGEKRRIVRDERWMERVIGELLKGPENKDLFNALPPGTRLNAVFVEGKTAYVDLSAEMAKNQSGGTSQEFLSVYAIVDTLTAFPEIEAVKILIDGKETKTLCGHIDISVPLRRDERIIAKVQ
uniref:GerMN domain-containing protein n=1 Tax=Candidatus Caldatribacterium californiense TaxID=1454726 RepID=A0A7V3YLA6_9BACT